MLIPTRDRPELTARAVRSVLGQTHEDLHLFVVDDGSTPANGDRLAADLAGESRATLIRNVTAEGPALARQRALEAGDAAWVAILDSDDEWHPTKLARQIDRAATTGADVVLCWFQWVRPDGTARVVRRPAGEGRVSPGLTNNIDVPLASRALVEAVGGFRGDASTPLRCDEHLDFMVRLLAAANVSTVPEVLVSCHDHAEARASDRAAVSVDTLAAVLRSRAGLFVDHPDDLAGLRARYSARLLAVGRRRDGLRELGRALAEAGWPTRRSLLREFGPHALKRSLTPW